MSRLALVVVLPLLAGALGCADSLPTAPSLPPLALPARTAELAALADEANEADALAISRQIQEHHWPWHTLTNPRYASGDPASPDFTTVVGYTQAADNAIWTGHYLAAEAFRFGVTRSPEALANARRALDGITALVDVTGTDVLARFLIPTSSPYLARILEEEARHSAWTTTYQGQSYTWLGNTSRDQYSGVFFGLGVAYDLIDDEGMRAQIRGVVGRLLTFLLRNGWNVRMPDGTYSTTFLQRPEQQLSFLQVGRRVDPVRWDVLYRAYRSALAGAVSLPIIYECFDPHGSYYKFNLDHINLYNLIRLEEAGPYRTAYLTAFTRLRGCTGSHGNAHFNMIERGLRGPGDVRDAETRELLRLWLQRPRRDWFVDNSDTYAACGTNRSCTPIRVDERYNTDFLWQRSPFQLMGGEDGTVPTPGVDYILPYWMARWYGVLTT